MKSVNGYTHYIAIYNKSIAVETSSQWSFPRYSRQSIVAPEAFTTTAHFARSALTVARNCSGVS
jgi:hypothetical protein